MNERFMILKVTKRSSAVVAAMLLTLGAAAVLAAQTNSSPNLGTPSGPGLGLFSTFLTGVAGAACMYLYWFRTERIQKAIASFHAPKKGEPFVQTENIIGRVSPTILQLAIIGMLSCFSQRHNFLIFASVQRDSPRVWIAPT
jgi:hypothetical protein